MFTDAMRERQQDQIWLNGVSPVGLGLILEYAYTSKITLNLSEYSGNSIKMYEKWLIHVGDCEYKLSLFSKQLSVVVFARFGPDK